MATIILAAAAILTAWAAFQSAKWSGIQAIEFSRANAARVESTRLDISAGQQTSVDVDVFLSWIGAVRDEIASGEISIEDGPYVPVEGTLSGFIYLRTREEFRPAFDAWLATRPLLDPSAPPTPFAMEEYELADAVEADALLTRAGEHTDAALQANLNSDNHVLTAVALALALFFAGVSSKLKVTRNRLVAISLAVVVFTGAGLVLLFLPKVSPF